MCHAQRLDLGNKQIGDAGVTALAKACAGGAMAQLKVSSLPTALSPDPETWHAHFRDSDFCMLCNTQELHLFDNQIGDLGLQAFSTALAGGALAHLTVNSHPTALTPCLEPWHARSPGLIISFDVPHVPFSGT